MLIASGFLRRRVLPFCTRQLSITSLWGKRETNGRFRDPLHPIPMLEEEFPITEPQLPTPLPNTTIFSDVMKEVERYGKEWKDDALPDNLRDFLINTTAVFQQMREVETTQLIESNAGKYRHNDLFFLPIKDQRGPYEPIPKPVVPIEPDMPQPAYEAAEYNPKQERLSLDYNYNFEQYRDFARKHAEMRAKEEKKAEDDRRLMKYLKTVENRTTNGYLKRMNMTRAMIQAEDEKLDLTNVKVPGKKKRSKKTINERRKGDLSTYDAWRCSDRRMITFGSIDKCNAKAKLIPTNLVKVSSRADLLDIRPAKHPQQRRRDQRRIHIRRQQPGPLPRV